MSSWHGKRKIGICDECGEERLLERHHLRIPLIPRGKNQFRLLCERCHAKYHIDRQVGLARRDSVGKLADGEEKKEGER